MQGFDWIRTELTTKRVAASELVRVTLRYGNVGTIRRMGALLDRAGIPAALLRKLEQGLKRCKSLIAWNPVRPKRGTVDRRWGVVWNDRV
jgi:predicted transcriptional regulator of viral defense system